MYSVQCTVYILLLLYIYIYIYIYILYYYEKFVISNIIIKLKKDRVRIYFYNERYNTHECAVHTVHAKSCISILYTKTNSATYIGSILGNMCCL